MSPQSPRSNHVTTMTISYLNRVTARPRETRSRGNNSVATVCHAGAVNPSNVVISALARMRIATFARAIHRRLCWDIVGILISVSLVAVACYALFHLLRDVDIERVGAALRAAPPAAVIAAGLLVAASYFTLTFYDYFALRTIGQTHIPYRAAAFTGFVAYTIGHNIGATVLTAGLVRLRVYRRWSLGLVDVAKIAFITGLTFWLGNAAVLGVGLAYAPETASAINQLPPWLNRCDRAGGAGGDRRIYLLWLLPRRRVVGRNGWKVTLPGARSTLLQIAIGMADLGLAALAMYVLISAYAPVDLVNPMVAYVLAALLGFASHAPGGLGVFDAAMLLALPQVGKEQLLAALLIFRCLYYLIPFCIAVVAFAAQELRLASRRPIHAPDT